MGERRVKGRRPVRPVEELALQAGLRERSSWGGVGSGLLAYVHPLLLLLLQAFRQNAWQQVQAPKGDLRAIAKLYEGM